MADTLPVVVTAAGAQPTPPAVLLQALLTAVAAVTPGYTANLPGSMIEDMSSTGVGNLALIDSARVEAINSITPYGANAYMLSQLGQIYIGPGAAPAAPTNTSVLVVFQALDPITSAPLSGQPIPVGFTVGDGTYQYVVQDDGVTDTNGFSQPLFCLATIAGSWAVPTNSVTLLVTGAPPGVTLSCTNPESGVSGGPAETEGQYRSRVFQAGQAISQGTTTLLKTLLANVPGVQQRLISVLQQPGGWEVIVGGGDPYEVAAAIFDALFYIPGLVGSTLAITGITNANPGVVTTALNHGLVTGDEETLSQIVGMTPLNGQLVTVTVIDEKRFSVGIDTTGFPAYVSGGVVTPNPRNEAVSINDYPDIYVIPFVNPPQQTVTVAATWSTDSPNFVSSASVAQATAPAIAAYINAIIVGRPMSILEMESTFLAAVAPVLDPSLVSNLTFAVSINGVATAPVGKLVFGDPESYFATTTSSIAVTQA